jgi:hypothetical protein
MNRQTAVGVVNDGINGEGSRQAERSHRAKSNKSLNVTDLGLAFIHVVWFLWRDMVVSGVVISPVVRFLVNGEL